MLIEYYFKIEYIKDINNIKRDNVFGKYPGHISKLATLKIRNSYFNILTTI